MLATAPAPSPSAARRYNGGSRFLDALPAAEREALVAAVQVIDIEVGPVPLITDTDAYVDFPIDAMYSVVASFGNGSSCEVGTIGREGVAPADLLIDAHPLHRTHICQVAGSVARMRRDAFLDVLAGAPALRGLLERHVRVRLFAAEQYTACNNLHAVIQRCARWLLLSRDCVGRDTLALTQDFLATMLSVRRAGVSESIAALSETGAISHRRGRISVVDRALLERAACDCYPAIRESVEAAYASLETPANTGATA